MAITLVSTITVTTSSTGSIDFQNIPATGKDLLLQMSLDTDGGFDYDSASIRINGDATGTYKIINMRQATQTVSTTVQNYGSGSFATALFVPGTNTSANAFGPSTLYISNYAGTNTKSMMVDTNVTNNSNQTFNGVSSLIWNQTAAIDRVAIIGRTFLQNSRISLYIVS